LPPGLRRPSVLGRLHFIYTIIHLIIDNNWICYLSVHFHISSIFNFIYQLRIFLGPDFRRLILLRGSRAVPRARHLPYRSASRPPYSPNHLALPLVAYPGARLAACLIGCLGISLAAPLATCLAAYIGTRLTAYSVAYLDACLIGCPGVSLATYLATRLATPSVAYFHADLAARLVAYRSARQPILPVAYSTQSLPRERTLRFHLTHQHH
jgi:hypothetical protein